ncbi:MAG: helix-turn-helix domain-containing protein [Erysipelotrichaceae bacterium]|nr:helix-turn-helix domain-containing protein [Erysipelotrichaceae bacterium]MDY5251123.1 helix-turn-helix domain-containing protein [Erysipelotrichaceae bacterium]
MITINQVNNIDIYYIQKIRKGYGDSAGQLCKEIGINKTHLYDIEAGRKSLSADIQKKILAYYNVQYNDDNRLYQEAYDLTLKLYESFVFKNNELSSKYEKEFNEKEEQFANSRGFIFNDLMIAIINLLRDKTLTKIKLDEAKKYLSLYDSNIACIYGVIYGFAKSISYNLKDTKSIIFEIYNKYPTDQVFPSIKGIFYYQLGRIYQEENFCLEALKYYQEAITALQTIYCIERVNQVNIEIANTLLSLQLYKQAENKYLELLAEAKKYGFERRTCACLNNLAYLYLIQKQYDKCEEFVYKAKKAGSNHHDLNYYLAYCAYKTKAKEEARSIVTKLLQEEDDRYTARMMKMIQGFINNNTDKIDKFFSLIKNDILEINDTLEMKLLYEMIITYYLHKDYEKSAMFMDECFKLNIF